MAAISHHADNFDWVLGIFVALEVLAHGISARPEALGHCLIDDGDSGRCFGVGVEEIASLKKDDVHGFEIVGRYGVTVGAEFFSALHDMAGDCDIAARYIVS